MANLSQKSCLFCAATMLLAGGMISARQHPRPVSLAFEELPLPKTDDDIKAMRVSPGVTVTYSNGVKKTLPIGYEEVYRTGDQDAAGGIAGLLTNKAGKPILLSGGAPRISNQVDNNTVHPLPGGDVILLTHLESRPGGVQKTRLVKDADGWLKALVFKPVDIAPVNGTTANCAGSKTPWGTHLAAEEDGENDPLWFDPAMEGRTDKHIAFCARDAAGILTGAPAKGREGLAGWCERIAGLWRDYHLSDPAYTPYNYGYHLEIAVDKDGNTSHQGGVKRYTLGKGGPEMALVMPDRRTVYITDDGAYRHFLMFRADKAGDLSSGVLYGARMKQQGPTKAGVSWIRLGSNHVNELKKQVFSGLTFSDFWEVGEVNACPVAKGFRLVVAGDNPPLCLRLRDGLNGSKRSEKFQTSGEVRNTAAFLETRRLTGWLGGTTEFQKAEAVSFDPDRRRLYLAVSNVANGLEKGPAEPAGLPDHLQFEKNKCGAVWAFELGSDRVTGSAFGTNRMTVFIQGKSLKPGQPHADMHACDPGAISSPDNLRYIGADTLLVGEDTGYHLNNMVFAVNTLTGKQTRIATVPFGGEVTGMFNGLAWRNETLIFFNTQAPMGDRVLVNALGVPQKAQLVQGATERDQGGRVGYLYGLPVGLRTE